MCLNIETHKNVNFPFGTNGILMDLGVPILKHIRVCYRFCIIYRYADFIITGFSKSGIYLLIWNLRITVKIPEIHDLGTILTENAWLFNGKKSL